MRQRQYCEFTYWINTTHDDLCTHCIRIVGIRLCIDDMSDRNFLEIHEGNTVRENSFARKMCGIVFCIISRIYSNGRATVGDL